LIRQENPEKLWLELADLIKVGSEADAGLAADPEVIAVPAHLHAGGFKVRKQRHGIHMTTSSHSAS
jgi:hypothetical protein